MRFFLALCISLFSPLLLVDSASAGVPFSLEKNFIKADSVYYHSEMSFLEASGNVRALSDNYFMKSERAYIDFINQRLLMNKGVYVESPSQKFQANSLFVSQARGRFLAKGIKLKLNDSDLIVAKKAAGTFNDNIDIYDGAFSPCKICINNKPLWQINSKETHVNFKEKSVSYKNASFAFAGRKIFFLPFFSHPLGDADPKSGLLKPSIYKGSLRVPIYLYLYPNMDATYTPRIGSKIFIHELEFRHLQENGDYQIIGSFAKGRKGKDNAFKNKDRFHINVAGKYNYNSIHYGYRYEQVSDKSYLKNYYQDYRSYLKSNLYLYEIYDDGYFQGDIQKYQGLRHEDKKSVDPLILPSLLYKRDVNFDNGWALSAKEQFIQYNEPSRKNISRNSLELNLSKSFNSEFGAYGNISLSNYFDLYKVDRVKQKTFLIKDKLISKNTPEIQMIGKLPIAHYGQKATFIVEPQISIVTGVKKPGNSNRHNLIDSANMELNENNIFSKSRFSGVDYREYGTRLSYGVNNYLISENWAIGGFLGQLLRSENDGLGSKSNYVGKISYSWLDNFEIYYRFQRRSRDFRSIRDEVVTYLYLDRLTFQNNLTFLRDLKKFYQSKEPHETLESDAIRQNFTQITFKVDDNLSVFGELRLNFSKKHHPRKLSDGMGFTYSLDCVALSARIKNNYTSDPIRGIIKNRSFSATLGLKTLNM
ncbi:MAG: LPS assembly protein LptD [Rickettsiaceae bacterium]|nr:LPS assembly protein LptD [Rickettsiaceae bacterium]